MLATTCEGSGEASGVLLENGIVLTAASAVKTPLSIVIVTPDNQIRQANLLGTSADGVAVLRMIGQLEDEPIPLATADPDPKSELAQIGYTAAGQQRIQPVGTTERPRALSEVMNAAKLGGPVVDKDGQVVGLVVGDTVQAATIIGLAKLRAYTAPKPVGLTVEAGGKCARSRGPQSPVVPELQVASTPLAVEAQRMLGDYLTLENRHDFTALQAVYSKYRKKSMSPTRDRDSHQTSYFFDPKITGVSAYGADGAYARMTFNVLFSPDVKGAGGLNCRRFDQRYRLVREGGKLVMDGVEMVLPGQACD